MPKQNKGPIETDKVDVKSSLERPAKTVSGNVSGRGDRDLPVYFEDQEAMEQSPGGPEIYDTNMDQYTTGDPSVDGSRPVADRAGVREPEAIPKDIGMPGSFQASKSAFSEAADSANDPEKILRDKRYQTRGNSRAQSADDAGDADSDTDSGDNEE